MPDGALARREAGPPALRSLQLPLRYPRLTLTLILWALGLAMAFFPTSRLPAITPGQTTAFQAKVKQAQAVEGELAVAERALMEAELDQAQHKVWFWRLKPDARREVEARQPAVDAAQQRVAQVRGRRTQLLREAKAQLGLWSEAGVEEGRELFAESFQSGKVFAQRQSFWDALFVVLGSRDRDWFVTLLDLLFRTLMNFLCGMIVAVFVFLAQLPALIWSYQPALWSGIAFFCLAAVAAVSVIASYLGLLFGAGATATYATLSFAAAQQQRLEGGGSAAARRRITSGSEGRLHHD